LRCTAMSLMDLANLPAARKGRYEAMTSNTEAGGANGTAQAAQQRPGLADNAADHSNMTHSAGASAQAATAHASLGDEPSWIYAMVVAILGIALLTLVTGIIIASLSGSRTISTDVVSATTLILGGLIGILTPTPGTKRSPRP
jgi:hypothetical protein